MPQYIRDNEQKCVLPSSLLVALSQLLTHKDCHNRLYSIITHSPGDEVLDDFDSSSVFVVAFSPSVGPLVACVASSVPTR